MLLLKRPGFEIETTSAVIKGADFARILTASEIIDEAQAYAARLREQIAAEHAQRREEGYESGLNEAREEMALQLFEMVGRTASYLEHVEDEVVKLVIHCLKQILATLPPDEVIVQTARKALSVVMANQKQIILRVAHEQAEAVQRRVNELLAGFPGILSIDVTPDARLSGTACILETEVGVVEAGAEVQMRAIERVLRNSLRREG